MNDNQHTFLEIIAPSVDEAIAKGLEDLGLPREAVDVEILDKGRRGLLGMGSRQVRIRLFIKKAGEAGNEAKSGANRLPEEIPSQKVSAELSPDTSEERDDEEDEIIRQISQETLSTLLGKMKIRAKVIASYEEKSSDSKTNDQDGNRRILVLNVTGQDLSILIGRQAETLHALQFITSLMINKKAGKAVPILVDIEGYRDRRKRQLLQMAKRMADQAVRTGRRQVLEPMSAEDRRTVHLELRNHPDVFTESIGEEPRRKVTIVPK